MQVAVRALHSVMPAIGTTDAVCKGSGSTLNRTISNDRDLQMLEAKWKPNLKVACGILASMRQRDVSSKQLPTSAQRKSQWGSGSYTIAHMSSDGESGKHGIPGPQGQREQVQVGCPASLGSCPSQSPGTWCRPLQPSTDPPGCARPSGNPSAPVQH